MLQAVGKTSLCCRLLLKLLFVHVVWNFNYEHFVNFDLQAEYQLQERYFNDLVKKEQMEEKMRGVREMKCRAVTCKKVLVQLRRFSDLSLRYCCSLGVIISPAESGV